MLCKSCGEHQSGKTCTEVCYLGLCLGAKCTLYKRVKQFFLKQKRFNELVALGVNPTTVWDFSERGMRLTEQRKEKAKRWLERYGELQLK